jgi:hypothetical protein
MRRIDTQSDHHEDADCDNRATDLRNAVLASELFGTHFFPPTNLTEANHQDQLRQCPAADEPGHIVALFFISVYFLGNGLCWNGSVGDHSANPCEGCKRAGQPK